MTLTGRGGRLISLGVAALLASAGAAAATPMVSIIIDDLGNQRLAGERAARLPGPVALAFLPFRPYTEAHARLAHAQGKEVLLHLPMEPRELARAHPVAITATANRDSMAQALERALANVPHVRGVNNHQGSLLTERTEPMRWLMSALAVRGGLYFVDSRTSSHSVAYREARAHGLPAAERHFFLDHNRHPAVIRAALRDLVRRALRDERALAIAHPHPETLEVLEAELPRLAEQGVRLVAPSVLIAAQHRRFEVWAGYKLATSLGTVQR